MKSIDLLKRILKRPGIFSNEKQVERAKMEFFKKKTEGFAVEETATVETFLINSITI